MLNCRSIYKILLLDGDSGFVSATNTFLESRSDYKLSTDSDDVFALSIKKLRDLIILHVLMPFESVFTAARKLRADPELGEIPVFL